MKQNVDRTISTIPLTVGEHTDGYWMVKSTTGAHCCPKCAFYKGPGVHSTCPVIYMETGDSPQEHHENGTEDDGVFELERQSLMCTCFGDTAPVYFVKVEEDDL